VDLLDGLGIVEADHTMSDAFGGKLRRSGVHDALDKLQVVERAEHGLVVAELGSVLPLGPRPA
jgi:hypothetical protein